MIGIPGLRMNFSEKSGSHVTVTHGVSTKATELAVYHRGRSTTYLGFNFPFRVLTAAPRSACFRPKGGIVSEESDQICEEHSFEFGTGVVPSAVPVSLSPETESVSQFSKEKVWRCATYL